MLYFTQPSRCRRTSDGAASSLLSSATCAPLRHPVHALPTHMFVCAPATLADIHCASTECSSVVGKPATVVLGFPTTMQPPAKAIQHAANVIKDAAWPTIRLDRRL